MFSPSFPCWQNHTNTDQQILKQRQTQPGDFLSSAVPNFRSTQTHTHLNISLIFIVRYLCYVCSPLCVFFLFVTFAVFLCWLHNIGKAAHYGRDYQSLNGRPVLPCRAGAIHSRQSVTRVERECEAAVSANRSTCQTGSWLITEIWDWYWTLFERSCHPLRLVYCNSVQLNQ